MTARWLALLALALVVASCESQRAREPPAPDFVYVEAKLVETFFSPIGRSATEPGALTIEEFGSPPRLIYRVLFVSRESDPGLWSPSHEYEYLFAKHGFDAPYSTSVVQVCGRGDEHGPAWTRCFHRTRVAESMWSDWQPSWP